MGRESTSVYELGCKLKLSSDNVQYRTYGLGQLLMSRCVGMNRMIEPPQIWFVPIYRDRLDMLQVS